MESLLSKADLQASFSWNRSIIKNSCERRTLEKDAKARTR
jgi:hypothetical protein